VPYRPPIGFVVDVTPLTLISVGVTPGSLTAGNEPAAAVLPVLPDVVVVPFDFPELELPHAAAAIATVVRTASQRARIQ
jgi:hypothetical protein